MTGVGERDSDGGGFDVTVLAAPNAPAALVCLAGEIDQLVAPVLLGVADRLSAAAPARVVIDLAMITFTCSTLPNFIARLHHVLPSEATILMCRPTVSTRRILQISDTDRIATVRALLPADGYTLVTHPA